MPRLREERCLAVPCTALDPDRIPLTRTYFACPLPHPLSRPAEGGQVLASTATAQPSAFAPVSGVGVGGHPTIATPPPPPCERCLLLSETLEDLRERARMQQRLLEHSDKLLVVATQRPDGRLEAGTPTPTPAATSPLEAHGAPSENGAPMIPANGDGGGRGDHQPGASVHASAAAAAPPAAAGAGENEELLAAAEAVWRISELARSALEEELDRREDALAAAAKAARESKEELSEQVGTYLVRFPDFLGGALGHRTPG